MVRFHFSQETASCSEFLQDHLEILNAGSDEISIGLMKFKEVCGKVCLTVAIVINVNRLIYSLMFILQNCDEGSELGSLFSDIELRNMEIRQLSRKVSRPQSILRLLGRGVASYGFPP